jgi:hypothetical protein
VFTPPKKEVRVSIAVCGRPGVYFTGLLVEVCHEIFDIDTFSWIRSLLGPDYRVDVF